MTKFTDYGLRVLIALAVTPERSVGVAEIAGKYDLSQHHLAKIATALVAGGFILSERGRNGGLRLARPAEDIKLGSVVRYLSRGDTMVECMGNGSDGCCITRACGLRGPLEKARDAFYGVLDGYALSDCITQRDALRELLAI